MHVCPFAPSHHTHTQHTRTHNTRTHTHTTPHNTHTQETHTRPSPPHARARRRLIPQTKGDLRDLLRRGPARPYEARLSDLHALLWLSRQPNLDPTDVLAVCEAVRDRRPLMEGYRVIIDSIAGID
jgi:hypothetical protein